jgi:hypothetical protein
MDQGFTKKELNEALQTLLRVDFVLKVVTGKHANGAPRKGILVFADPSPQLTHAQIHTLPTRTRA